MLLSAVAAAAVGRRLDGGFGDGLKDVRDQVSSIEAQAKPSWWWLSDRGWCLSDDDPARCPGRQPGQTLPCCVETQQQKCPHAGAPVATKYAQLE
jgi:hypothetical protein